jgi:hypothetical protein
MTLATARRDFYSILRDSRHPRRIHPNRREPQLRLRDTGRLGRLVSDVNEAHPLDDLATLGQSDPGRSAHDYPFKGYSKNEYPSYSDGVYEGWAQEINADIDAMLVDLGCEVTRGPHLVFTASDSPPISR